jgi:stearoyl-CoA desaturase (delta-9 desaturase)
VTAVSLYTVAGLGISVGWHRFFTHKGFRCGRALTYVLAIAGSLAFEGSLASWVANHRVHHAHTDVEGDPHSPWTERGLVRGFIHAHIGWLGRPIADESRFARDVLADKHLARISRFWWAWALAGMLVPAAVAGAFSGWKGFVGMAAWSGVVRVVFFHHVTWSVNSVCHVLGSRRYETTDQSRNVWWLALFSFGESWHNNHHYAPRLARHGVGRGQLDVSAGLLRLLERTKVVWDCRWVSSKSTV